MIIYTLWKATTNLSLLFYLSPPIFKLIHTLVCGMGVQQAT